MYILPMCDSEGHGLSWLDNFSSYYNDEYRLICGNKSADTFVTGKLSAGDYADYNNWRIIFSSEENMIAFLLRWA